MRYEYNIVTYLINFTSILLLYNNHTLPAHLLKRYLSSQLNSFIIHTTKLLSINMTKFSFLHTHVYIKSNKNLIYLIVYIYIVYFVN